MTGSRATKANEPIAVAHRAGPWVAFRPLECFRRSVEASHQGPARKGTTIDRIALGVVDAAEFDRVHAKRHGDLVHRAFERKHVRNLEGRAHEAWRIAVDTNDTDHGVDIRRIIDPRGGLYSSDVIFIGPRGQLTAFMPERLEFAAARGAELNPVSPRGRVRS
jgi:hypothetical protein